MHSFFIWWPHSAVLWLGGWSIPPPTPFSWPFNSGFWLQQEKKEQQRADVITLSAPSLNESTNNTKRWTELKSVRGGFVQPSSGHRENGIGLRCSDHSSDDILVDYFINDTNHQKCWWFCRSVPLEFSILVIADKSSCNLILRMLKTKSKTIITFNIIHVYWLDTWAILTQEGEYAAGQKKASLEFEAETRGFGQMMAMPPTTMKFSSGLWELFRDFIKYPFHTDIRTK